MVEQTFTVFTISSSKLFFSGDNLCSYNFVFLLFKKTFAQWESAFNRWNDAFKLHNFSFLLNEVSKAGFLKHGSAIPHRPSLKSELRMIL